MMLFGERNVLESFRSHPPDLVVFTDEDTSEYGLGRIGQDYGRQLGDWIRQNYRPLKGGLIGATPLSDKGFGILLLERGKVGH